MWTGIVAMNDISGLLPELCLVLCAHHLDGRQIIYIMTYGVLVAREELRCLGHKLILCHPLALLPSDLVCAASTTGT